jgi:hypothetical protein
MFLFGYKMKPALRAGFMSCAPDGHYFEPNKEFLLWDTLLRKAVGQKIRPTTAKIDESFEEVECNSTLVINASALVKNTNTGGKLHLVFGGQLDYPYIVRTMVASHVLVGRCRRTRNYVPSIRRLQYRPELFVAATTHCLLPFHFTSGI